MSPFSNGSAGIVVRARIDCAKVPASRHDRSRFSLPAICPSTSERDPCLIKPRVMCGEERNCSLHQRNNADAEDGTSLRMCSKNASLEHVMHICFGSLLIYDKAITDN